MDNPTILLDLNHTAYRNKFTSENSFGGFYKEAWSYQLLNSILKIADNFYPWNDFVLCVDSKRSWRKMAYLEYKANRKKDRDKDKDGNWLEFFEAYKNIQAVIKQTLPFRIIEVDGAEGDDIMATLSLELGNSVIITSDKDMLQCTAYDNVSMYDPIKEQYITSGNPRRDLEIKIRTGDKGDNIPSIGERIGPKTAEKLIDKKNETTREMWQNIDRNRLLIDFDYIPVIVVDNIIKEYHAYTAKSRMFDEDKFFEFVNSMEMSSYISKWDDICEKIERYVL